MAFDLEMELLPASKKMTEQVALVCLTNAKLLDQLITIALSDEKVLSWHACWVIERIARMEKNKLTPYVDLLIQTLPKLKHPSQIRPILFTLTVVEIDCENNLDLLDYCIERLKNERYPYNEKARALMILEKYVTFEPELKGELFPIVESVLPFTEKPHFRKHLNRFLTL